jgi:hypothetical protein
VGPHARLGIPPGAKYFNAGVMVVDMERWRRDDVPGQVLDYLRQYRDTVFFMDQEGLNAVLAGKWGELDPRWNHNASIPSYRRRHAGTGGASGAGDREPWIVHFAGTLKPWRYGGGSSHRHLYYSYLDTTAWAGWRPAPTLGGRMVDMYESSRLRVALYPLEQWGMRLIRILSRRSVAGPARAEGA